MLRSVNIIKKFPLNLFANCKNSIRKFIALFFLNLTTADRDYHSLLSILNEIT